MFENNRWIFLILVVAIVGAGYSAHYLSVVDSANLALQESKSKLTSMHELIGQRRTAWGELQKSISINREQQEKYGALVKAKEILVAKSSKIEADFKSMSSTIKVAVERFRNDAPGQVIGDMTLTNGKMLRDVKIRKVDESGAAVIHADGIGTITVDLLPSSFVEKYDLGESTLQLALTEAEQTFLGKNDAATKTKAVAATAKTSMTPSAPTKVVDDAKVKDLKLKIASLLSRIEASENSIQRYNEVIAQHQTLASEAQAKGRPSSMHFANASKTQAQLNQIQNQIAAMREERRKLEVELEYANKPK